MPIVQYSPNPRPLTQAELDELARQQEAMGASVPAGGYKAAPAPTPSPPPYDPAQDTQGMQAQPAPITVAPPVADPTQRAEASYQQGLYNQQIAQPGPEYDTQTIAPAAPTPTPATTTPYGPPPSQGYATQIAGSGTGERMPPPVGMDVYQPFAGSERSVPVERARRKFGRVGSWYETPTTPGAWSAPPPDNPNRGKTDLLGAVLGTGRFLANYGPGGRADLGATLLDNFSPVWSPETADTMSATLNPSSPTAYPDWLRWAVNVGRNAWYDNPEANPYYPETGYTGTNPMDTTDAYMGNDPGYLRTMASMPEYLTRFRPAAARILHEVTKLPGPSYSPPYLPGMEPPPPGPDAQAEGVPRDHYLHPEAGIYYDDPYIPGPDYPRRRRRTA